MAGFTTFLQQELLDHIGGNGAYTAPTPYVGLYTAAPSDAGGGTEVTGGSYARQAVATGASSGWDAASGGATQNTAMVTFPTATANWGTVTHVGLFDAITSGNLLMHGALSASQTINNGNIFRFNAGDLDISLA